MVWCWTLVLAKSGASGGGGMDTAVSRGFTVEGINDGDDLWALDISSTRLFLGNHLNHAFSGAQMWELHYCIACCMRTGPLPNTLKGLAPVSVRALFLLDGNLGRRRPNQ